MIQVLTRDIGGAPLVKAALAHQVPETWYAPVPTNGAEWSTAARDVANEFKNKNWDWLPQITPAFNATGPAAEQLARVAAQGGVVVTTGQQPGLFGGPMYTWSKAFSALTLAREIERQTGIPTAPIFWAATDDADYAEASYTVVAHNGEGCILRLPDRDSGPSMASIPLGDISAQFATLARAAGSVIDHDPLDTVKQAYSPGTTIGGAYLTLLRAVLEPLGMAVLDANHPSVRVAAEPTLRSALQNATSVRDALAGRSQAIEAAGYRAQVQPVPNLSLVFRTDPNGLRARVSLKDA
ncbi:MAG TPA: bacillithiol biosynthesis BshC, partial [Gemmatimonadaceae bacterium]|nr:bacillithiol biosynthesis BshC [Gemmatimonadaceae bacterium]